jgi:hypothetical protein
LGIGGSAGLNKMDLTDALALIATIFSLRLPNYFTLTFVAQRGHYLRAAVCLMNAVTTSFCANAMALLAVVIWAPASSLGNCIDR